MKLKFTEKGIWDEDCNKCGDDGVIIMHVDHTDYEHAVADFITKENYNNTNKKQYKKVFNIIQTIKYYKNWKKLAYNR